MTKAPTGHGKRGVDTPGDTKSGFAVPSTAGSSRFSSDNFARQILDLGRQGRHAEVLKLLENAGKYELLAQMGDGAVQTGDLDLALHAYIASLRIAPEQPDVLNNLGIVFRRLGRDEKAKEHFIRASRLAPNNSNAFINLGLLYSDRLDYRHALHFLKKAWELDPVNAQLGLHIAATCKMIYHHIECRDILIKLLAKEPDNPFILQDLSNISAYLCEWDDVLALSDKALHSSTSPESVWESRIYTLSYHPDLGAERIFSEFIAWGDRYPMPSLLPTYQCTREPERRLRVGFVSPDFRAHSSRFFFQPLFRHIDHGMLEMFAYSNVRCPDEHTEEFKGFFDHWRDIRRMPAEDAAKLILDDQIDILMDGCNHMLDHRLDVFALKPAPVQSTWLGSAWTSGLRQMDYVIFDPVLAPVETLTREQIVRLPHCFIAYEPRSSGQDVQEPPSLRNGYITFGYSGRTERLNAKVFRAWAAILSRIPTARLLLDFGAFGVDGNTEHFLNLFSKYGIDCSRVIMRFSSDIFKGLHDIDILLDSFPHSGGTMLIDALWMGVPVLSLAERPPLGRIGTTLLSNLNLHDWIAVDEQDYVCKAVTHGLDTQELTRLRAGFRLRMLQSPLMDGRGFSWSMQAAWRMMWRRYCAGLPPLAFDVPGEAAMAGAEASSDLHTPAACKSQAEVELLLEDFKRLYANRQFAEAAEAASFVTMQAPEAAKGWKALGAALDLNGKCHEAVAALQRACALSPDDMEIYDLLGMSLAKSGQISASKAVFEQGLQKAPQDSRLQRHYAQLLSQAGTAS